MFTVHEPGNLGGSRCPSGPHLSFPGNRDAVREFILNNGPDYEQADALKARLDQALAERGFSDVQLQFNGCQDCWELGMMLGQNPPPFTIAQTNGLLRAIAGELGFQVPPGRVVSIVLDGRIQAAFNLVPLNAALAG